jgi:hypothetical protein
MFRSTTLAEVPDVRLTPFIEGADGPLPGATEETSTS